MTLATAIQQRDPDLLPSRRDEAWRWTGLRELIRAVPPPSPRIDQTVQPGGPFEGVATNEFVVANGWMSWWPDEPMLGVEAFVSDEAGPSLRADLPMISMAARHAADRSVSIVQFNADDDRVALLRFVSEANSTSHHARVGINVKAGARAILLESHEGKGDDYLANNLLEIFLETGSSLERVVIADDAASAIAVTTAEVHLEPGARFSQTVLASGAKRQRFETHLVHPGEGAEVRLDGAYVLAGKRHSDQTSIVTHAGEGGVTSQLTKGVAADQARGVFQGRIVVERGADGTDARMAHHALLLSDRAEIDAKPELEIYADDVSCAHGNTVGALSDEAIFYARSRGVPEAAARIMLTAAFLGDVVERIENEPAREIARAWVEARLEALA